MPLLLFILLIVVPAVEIFVIVQVVQAIGFALTLLLLIAGAILGSYVMRRAGASWWRALRGRVEAADGTVVAGQRPDGRAAAHAALLFLAGLLIFLPGFITDAVGLVLLLPPVRAGLQAATAAWFVRRFTSVAGPGGVRIWTRSDRVVRGDVVRGDVDGEDPPEPPQLP